MLVLVVHGRPCGHRQWRRRQPGSRGGGATPWPDPAEAGLGPHTWSSWGRRVLGPRLHRCRGDGGTSREGHGLDPWLHGGLDRTVAGKVPGGGSRGRARGGGRLVDAVMRIRRGPRSEEPTATGSR